MEFQFKVLWTIAALIGVLLISLAITPAHKDDGRWWKGGTRDPFYRALYTPDGTFRRQSKAILIAVMVLGTILVWALA